jgi:hypothetical protein
MKHLKIISTLFILLIFDLLRPLGNELNVDFLFLGIIFLAMNWRPKHSLLIAVFIGHVKDCFMPPGTSFSMLELPLICLGIHYFSSLFLFIEEKGKFLVKIAMVTSALLIHALFLIAQSGAFLPNFTAQFIIQSFFVYFFLNFFLNSWIFSSKNFYSR